MRICACLVPIQYLSFYKQEIQADSRYAEASFWEFKTRYACNWWGCSSQQCSKNSERTWEGNILASGGAILGHPLGPTEGAKSMMQAAEALGKGISLEEAALKKENEALKISIKKWE